MATRLVLCLFAVLFATAAFARDRTPPPPLTNADVTRILDAIATGDRNSRTRAAFYRGMQNQPDQMVAAVLAREFDLRVFQMFAQFVNVLRDRREDVIPLIEAGLERTDEMELHCALSAIGNCDLARAYQKLMHMKRWIESLPQVTDEEWGLR